MNAQDRTKEQLIYELAEMRQQIARLQASEAKHMRMEEELRESEERYRDLFENARDLIYTEDLRGNITNVNRAIEEYGLNKDEVIGKNQFEFVPRKYWPRLLLESVKIARGKPVEGEIEISTPERTIKAEYRSNPIRRGKEVIGAQTIMRDITERKQAEKALRESEELLRATLESTADGILVIGKDGKMMHANTRFAEMWWIPTAVLDSRDDDTLLDFVLDQLQDPEAFLTRVRYLYGSSEEDLDILQFKDGRIFERFSRPLLKKGSVVGRVWSFRDITERERAEETLRRRVEELAVLQATVLQITAPHDLPTLLQTIVERAARLLDAPSGGLYLCNPVQEKARCVVSYNTPSDYTGTVLKYGEGAAGTVAQTGQPLIIDDYRTWDRRATIFDEKEPFTAMLSVPMIWQGQVTGVIHVLRDLESQHFTQADLDLLTLFANHAAIAVENAGLYESVRQDAETKALLVDEVNHRVKNTLTAIIGLLYIEQSHAQESDQAMYETIIQSVANRVSGLATVHDLLSASEWEPLPLSDLAGQVIKSTLQMCPRAKQVFIDVPPSPVHVTPDQAHNLAMVITELATNTIQHTLPGRNSARIGARIALENDTILLEYRDDGPGYPEDVLRLERHAVGFDLIQNLVRQGLQGKLSLHNDEGAMASIRFPAQA